MRTAIDTNVLSALWGRESPAVRISQVLDEAKLRGGVMISPVVYMEARANPYIAEADMDRFLTATRVTVDWMLEREVWELATERFVDARRRRRQGGGEARRFPADYLVAAHALLRADRLVTLDQRSYRADFPELILVEP